MTRRKATLWNPLPDLTTLTDDDLRVMIRELEKEEDEISFRRRVLHGRIDILRAELVARLREQVSAGEAQLADVERLSEILAGRAAPVAADDLSATLTSGSRSRGKPCFPRVPLLLESVGNLPVPHTPSPHASGDGP